ncbi:hypothetical protein [Tenacibaculum halocynthiae]|uniref:hypothetical protein n=1 Tax=Tenacibaculum halocynthiae TaxID=1254437 RepID=UPI0038954466
MKVNILKIAFELELVTLDDLLSWSYDMLKKGYEHNFFMELALIHRKDKTDVLIELLDQYHYLFSISMDNIDEFSSLVYSFLIKKNDYNKMRTILIKYFNSISEDILNKGLWVANEMKERDYGFWISIKDDLDLRLNNRQWSMNYEEEIKKYFKYFEIKSYSNTSFFDVFLQEFVDLN